MKKIFVVLIILASCSAEPTFYSVQPDLKPYLDNFFSLAQARGFNFTQDNLILKLTKDLVKQKENAGLGRTTIHKDYKIDGAHTGQRTIEFDEDYWHTCTEGQRVMLSLHEFGHGYLGRQHSNGYSIMNVQYVYKGFPQCYGETCKMDLLINELFANRGQ